MRSVRQIRNSMFANNVDEMELLFQNSDLRYFEGVILGDLLKTKKYLVRLVKGQPKLRADGSSESFPVYFQQSVLNTGAKYMRLTVRSSSRLYRAIAGNLPADGLLLHRLIPFLAGKTIPPGFQVHHVNVNQLDNRRQNLVIAAAEEHREFHRGLDSEKTAEETLLTSDRFSNEFREGSEYYLHVIYYQEEQNNGNDWLTQIPNISSLVGEKMLRIIDAVRDLGRRRN